MCKVCLQQSINILIHKNSRILNIYYDVSYLTEHPNSNIP